MTTPLHVNQRRYAISKIPQENYTTETAMVDANYVEWLCKDKNFADDAPNVVDNREYSTGRAQPTEQWTVNHEATVAKEFDVCAEQIGRPLLAAMGKVTSGQPDSVGAAAVWKHLFERLDVETSRQLPAITVIEQIGASLDRAFPSCILENLGIRGEGSQRLMGSFQARGSGKILEDTGVEITALTGQHYFYESQVKLTLDDGSEITNFATAPQRLNSWSFEVANQLLADDGYRAGDARFQEEGDLDSGEVRTECLISDQMFNAAFNGRFLSDSDLHKAITSQKNFSALFDIVGAEITTVDTTEDTQGGDFNNTTNPLTVDLADYPDIDFAVGDYYKIGSEYLQVTAVGVATATLSRGSFRSIVAAHADAVSILKVYHNRLQIAIAKMPFKTRKITERNGLVVLDIVPNILFDVDAEKDVEIALYNTIASYTS